LAVEWHGTDAPKRFIFDIRDARVDLEIVEQLEHFNRCAGIDGELNVGVLFAVRGRERSHHRERRWNRGKTQASGQAEPERIALLSHRAAIADDAPCPFEYPLAFGCEALEPRAPIDQQDAHLVLKLLHAGGKRGLCHSARFSSASEVLFARQRQYEFKLVDQ